MTVWKLGSRGLRPRDSRGQGMRRGVGCRPRGLAHHEAPGWWTMRLLGALWISCVYSSAASACLRPRAAAPRMAGRLSATLLFWLSAPLPSCPRPLRASPAMWAQATLGAACHVGEARRGAAGALQLLRRAPCLGLEFLVLLPGGMPAAAARSVRGPRTTVAPQGRGQGNAAAGAAGATQHIGVGAKAGLQRHHGWRRGDRRAGWAGGCRLGRVGHSGPGGVRRGGLFGRDGNDDLGGGRHGRRRCHTPSRLDRKLSARRDVVLF